MKAKIHGIEVEGTPSEVAEFKLKIEKQINDTIEKVKQPNYTFPTWQYPMLIGDPVNPNYSPTITCCKNKTDINEVIDAFRESPSKP